MAHHGLALSKLFRPGIEGRYANDPHDRGGETYCGVARNFHGTWPGWAEIDRAKMRKEKLNSNEVFDRLLPHLQTFYHAKFWTTIKGDAIQDQGLADFLFANAVNMNSPQAVRLLQRAIGTNADGVVGPKTLVAINQAGPEALGRYAEYVRNFYQKIAVGDQARYLNGWLNRVAAYVSKTGQAVA